MAKVTGIGGIFFKSRDPAASRAWYAEHLGIATSDYGWEFRWSDAPDKDSGMTIWSPFSADSSYFAPSELPFMLNLRVDDLAGLLAQLQASGVPQIGETQVESYGSFAWILDPDGVKIELWQAPAEAPFT